MKNNATIIIFYELTKSDLLTDLPRSDRSTLKFIHSKYEILKLKINKVLLFLIPSNYICQSAFKTVASPFLTVLNGVALKHMTRVKNQKLKDEKKGMALFFNTRRLNVAVQALIFSQFENLKFCGFSVNIERFLKLY